MLSAKWKPLYLGGDELSSIIGPIILMATKGYGNSGRQTCYTTGQAWGLSHEVLSVL